MEAHGGVHRPVKTGTGQGWALEERLAPLAGVAVLPLGLAGLIVLEGPADRPEVDVSPSSPARPRTRPGGPTALALWRGERAQ